MLEHDVRLNFTLTDGENIAVGLYHVRNVTPAPIVATLCLDKNSALSFLAICEHDEIYTAFSPQSIRKLAPLAVLGIRFQYVAMRKLRKYSQRASNTTRIK